MSPTDSKRCATKRRKNKRSTDLVSSNLVDDLEEKSIAPSSSTNTSSSPSTSSVAFSLQTSATAASTRNENGLLLATDTAMPSISSEMIGKSEVSKKRCGGTINSRQTCKRSRISTFTADSASQVEPIDLEENPCEEVVDLTCESSDPVVVDLTCNDSVVIVEENVCQQRNQHLRSQQLADSCVLSSDDDEPRDNDVVLTDTLPRELELLEDGISSARRSGQQWESHGSPEVAGLQPTAFLSIDCWVKLKHSVPTTCEGLQESHRCFRS
uniref:Uncharacterized protein n=1 Tax=Anolis carolinensis TaxID=28377 RepID=G1KT71_ANOCA